MIPSASARFVDPDAGLPTGGVVLRPSFAAALEHLGHVFLLLAVLAVFAAPIGRALGQDPSKVVTGVLFSEGPFLVFAVLGVLGPILNLLFTRYVLTEEGIVVRTQFLSRKEQRVEWAKVTAVVHKWTLLDRLLRLERLDVVAYGAKGATLHLVGLRRAAPYRDLIARRMRAAASVAALFAND